MGLARIETAEAEDRARNTLGLRRSSATLLSREGIAASVRRAASFLCPTTPGNLARSVTEVLSGFPGFEADTAQNVRDIVSLCVGYGDLVELPLDFDGRTQRRLFLGQPAFVRRNARTALLIGIRPEGVPLVNDELVPNIEYRGHARSIHVAGDDSISDLLELEGLIDLHPNLWMKAPKPSSPEDLVATYTKRLDAAPLSGDVEGVTIIDPASRVTYYRGRWRVLKSRESGYFVGRRKQAVGADLWCFMTVLGGVVGKLVDLPLLSHLASGADEAWRLQAALDAARGSHQRVRVHEQADTAVLDFYAPLPAWAQRRLDVVGIPIERSKGALFSYSLPHDDLEAELHHLGEMMWTSPNDEGQ